MTTHQNENFYSTIQTISNHVLDLVKNVGDLSGDVRVLTEKLNIVECQINKIERTNRQIISMLSLKMEPEKCGYLHSELEKRIYNGFDDRIFDMSKTAETMLQSKIKENLKTEAKTIGKTVVFVLKIAAFVSLVFGGSALGIQALGLLKNFGG